MTLKCRKAVFTIAKPNIQLKVHIPLQPLRSAISQSQSWKDIDSWCWHFPRENHPGVKFCVTTDVVYFAFSFL